MGTFKRFILSCMVALSLGGAATVLAQQSGGGNVFGIIKVLTAGLFADGSASAPSLTFASETGTGWWRRTTGALSASVQGVQRAEVTSAGFNVGSGAVAFATTPGATADAGLSRLAAGSLALGNGTQGDTTGLLRLGALGVGTAAGAAGTITAAGDISGANIFASGNFRTTTAGAFYYANGMIIRGVANGQVNFTNFAETVGIGFDVLTDGTLKVRNRAQSADAQVTASSILLSSPLLGVGYTTGAGNAVTQLTSRTTPVTLNNVTGDITLVSAAGSATATSFTVTDSAVGANDNIFIHQTSGTNLYQVFVTSRSVGSFQVTFYTTGGVATDAPVFHFSVIKGAIS